MLKHYITADSPVGNTYVRTKGGQWCAHAPAANEHLWRLFDDIEEALAELIALRGQMEPDSYLRRDTLSLRVLTS